MATEDKYAKIRTETEHLYNNLRGIARLSSKRRLDDKTRLTFQQELMAIASLLNRAYEFADKEYPLATVYLRAARRFIHQLEVYILAAEEGEGKKMELPKMGDIKIDRSKEIKILQQAGVIEKPHVLIQYWREIVIGILLILITAILAYFIPGL